MTSSIVIRPITQDEVSEYIRTMFWAASRSVDSEFIQEQARTFHLERALAAFDGKDIVGTVGTRSLEITLPGGKKIAAAAIGQGGVLATHTRRGIMKDMLFKSYDKAIERGEPMAIWTVSEWPLYERYGSGVGTFGCTYIIHNPSPESIRDLKEVEGRVRMVEEHEITAIIVALHYECSKRPGGVARDEYYWERVFNRLKAGKSLDILESRQDYPAALFIVNIDENGNYNGCCVYRVHQKWNHGSFQTQLEVITFLAKSIASAKALWSFMFKLPMIDSILIPHGEQEHMLRWMLKDGRRLELKSTFDHIWLRLFEPARVLRQRLFNKMFEPIRIRYTDPSRYIADETLEIMSDGNKTEVTVSTGKPDVEMEIGILSALVLGGNSIWNLASAERIKYRSMESLVKFANAFVTLEIPFTDNHF